MKKIKQLSLILLLTLTAILAVGVFGFTMKSASASTTPKSPAGFFDDDDSYSSSDYTLDFVSYDITYDVATNRKLSVVEKITILFTGRKSTGFIKYIPINAGEQVRNIDVYEIISGKNSTVDYDVNNDELGFISVDIGDTSNKTNTTHTYVLTYDYCLTRAQEGKNNLYLNAIGVDRDAVIQNANITIKLPKGFKSANCYYGTKGSQKTLLPEIVTAADGTSIIGISDLTLAKREGVTVEMHFESGTLTKFFDFSPYIISIVSLLVLVVLIVVKLLVYNKNEVMPVVNYDVPNHMDPLLMGKLIDNVISNEDVTSLIYYWADKGYIKISLDDEKDPTLIRIMQHLPDGTPHYQVHMYNNMFASGDVVKTSQLKNKFYNTVTAVKAEVNKRTTGKLYEKTSIVTSIVFAIIGALIAVIAPIILGMKFVSPKLTFVTPIIAIIFVILAHLGTQALVYYSQKIKKGILLISAIGITVLCALLIALVMPSGIMDLPSRFLLGAVCAIISTYSTLIVTRTKAYTEQLNNIVGFKTFIELAEKDQLEMMLEQDPQFYYHILPYAQVLGVTDKWEGKFKSITVQPPQWLAGDMMQTYFEFAILNNILSRSMRNMSANMISHPSGSGKSGFGGFGGGHVGGGHGGGGFGGR